MNEIHKVAAFRLILSNRKKRLLKGIMLKFTNALADVLELVYPEIEDLEFKALMVKNTKAGDKYIIDTRKIERYILDIIEKSAYRNYRHRERLVQDISYNLASYFELRLKGENPSYPVKIRMGNRNFSDERVSQLYSELKTAGISDEGIDPDTHTRETDIISNIVKVQRERLQPIPFARYRDFQIIDQLDVSGALKKIALLDIITSESGKDYLRKNNQNRPTYKGHDVASNIYVEIRSVTKLPCVLEWSKHHQLNYFDIGTPKTAKLIYDNDSDNYYLHVSFQFLPHIDEEGHLHYIKRAFDEAGKSNTKAGSEVGKRNHFYKCYDALTGEVLSVKSTNKTTDNRTREANAYMGVDLGRAVLAAYAIVQDGRIHYKALAETEGLTKKLYDIYDEIARLQKGGKENYKKTKELYRKIEAITKQGVHRTANRIVWARDYYNCHLVLENLDGLKKLPRKKVQQYKRLSEVLTYKSQLKGFPLVTFSPERAYYTVRPSQTSKLCSRCGFTHPDNRRMEISQKDFRCQRCGYEANADINAAVNIARLGEYIFKYKDKYLNFDEYLKELAHCPNANFDEYRRMLIEAKRSKIVLKIADLALQNAIGIDKTIAIEEPVL